MLAPVIDFQKYRSQVSNLSLYRVKGKVKELTGLVVRAVVPNVRVGELCFIESIYRKQPIKAEVVGFKDNDVLLMPLGELEGIGPGNDVISTGNCLMVPVGFNLLGRILDGLGDPLDVDKKGPLQCEGTYPVHASPPDALKRRRILQPISVGIRSMDSLLTVGEGQRIGLFAAAGVGKSTLMGMIARNTEADINVICLVGERGREVRDFLEQDLGEEGIKRSVIVVSTSDQPSLVRAKAAYVATAIAEYFRDQGKKVILMMDSITRFARALREIGLAVGEPPARQGFTPSRDLAARGQYPAIDVSESVSRVMSNIVEKDHLEASRKLKEVVANYEKEKDLILIGAYESGSNPAVDYAIEKIEEVNNFLKQEVGENVDYDDAVESLKAIFS